MDKKDFEFDSDRFTKELGVTKFAVQGAQKKLLQLVDHWNEMSQFHLGRSIAFTSVPEENHIQGEVLGRSFTIHYAPLGKEGSGFVEASICIKHAITHEPISISQFLVNDEGAFLTRAGEVLMTREDPEFGYKILVAIARRVLSAESLL